MEEEPRGASFPYTEALVSQRPVIVRRQVIWGECDPAGVVYTPRFSEYLVAAYLWFARCELAALRTYGIGTPMKAMRLEFHKMLQMDDWFEMRVLVSEVRTRTFDVDIRAIGDDGKLRFSGHLTPIMFDSGSRKSTPMPESIRASLVAYAEID